GIPPFFGTWLSTIILAPLAIVLTHRATNDRQISIDFDWIAVPMKKIFGASKIQRLDGSQRIINLDAARVQQDDEWRELEAHSDDVLIGMVYNTIKFGYSQTTR